MHTILTIFFLFLLLSPAQAPNLLLGKWTFASFDFTNGVMQADEKQKAIEKASGTEITFLHGNKYQSFKKGGTAVQNASGIYNIAGDTLTIDREKVIIVQLDSITLRLHPGPFAPDLIFKRTRKE